MVLLNESCACADSDIDWYDEVVKCYDSARRMLGRGGGVGADRESESDAWSMKVQVDFDGE